jgi:hypothetical protein
MLAWKEFNLKWVTYSINNMSESAPILDELGRLPPEAVQSPHTFPNTAQLVAHARLNCNSSLLTTQRAPISTRRHTIRSRSTIQNRGFLFRYSISTSTEVPVVYMIYSFHYICMSIDEYGVICGMEWNGPGCQPCRFGVSSNFVSCLYRQGWRQGSLFIESIAIVHDLLWTL